MAAIPSDAAASTASLRTLGTSGTSATAGNDSRLSNARTPTSHKTSHATGGTDVLTPADIGAATTAALDDERTYNSATYARVHTGTVALLGDSISKQGTLQQGSGASLQKLKTAWGFWPRASVLLRQRLTVLPGPNVGQDSFGDGGLSIRQLIDNGHVAGAVAAAPEHLVFHAGTNSIGSADQSAASTFADYVEAVEMATDAGIKVWATTILPRVVSTETTAGQRTALRDCNRLIVEWARTAPNVHLVDWAGALVDPADGNGLQLYYRDFTHPNAIGASRMGKVLADAMAAHVPAADPTPDGLESGVMISGRSIQKGTGGTFSGSNPGGGSGSLPANMVCYVDTNVTVVASKVARTDVWPGEWSQFQITAATATTGIKASIQNGTSGGTWNIGDTVYAEVEFETDLSAWALRYLYAQATCNGTTSLSTDGSISSADIAMQTGALHQPGVAAGLFRTPAIVIPTGTNRMQIDLFFGGGLGTVRLGRAQMYRV
ncbi:SGNH/GDSL hydrolase family protein [Candidatus Saccharibacteria bacterium]|nr:SGNH/GDSL hydrolase family protein [Candidatus Saccharibacteria bacterium]MBI3338480.1 SGNH/GDSL hydrolase family protein [Candidatus Saccharibacteria bacterium]